MFGGAKYTIELRQIAESKHTKVFDFDYDFYDPQFKCSFEEKFIDHYYFNEIGFETVGRFKHNLKSRLNKKMPYWTKLYETELESEGLSFMLNKDLKETFIRTVDTEDKIIGSNKNNVESNNNDTTKTSETRINSQKETTTDKGSVTTTGHNAGSSHSEVDKMGTVVGRHEESKIADGVANVLLDDKYLTGVSSDHTSTTGKDTTESTNTDDYNSKVDNVSNTEVVNENIDKNNVGTTKIGLNSTKTVGNNTEDKTGKMMEKTELISQGNIGTTSSAELLAKWREVLLNIDELIIDDCQDLFMGIF